MRTSFFEVNSYADEPQEKEIKSYRLKILVLGAASISSISRCWKIIDIVSIHTAKESLV